MPNMPRANNRISIVWKTFTGSTVMKDHRYFEAKEFKYRIRNFSSGMVLVSGDCLVLVPPSASVQSENAGRQAPLLQKNQWREPVVQWDHNSPSLTGQKPAPSVVPLPSTPARRPTCPARRDRCPL